MISSFLLNCEVLNDHCLNKIPHFYIVTFHPIITHPYLKTKFLLNYVSVQYESKKIQKVHLKIRDFYIVTFHPITTYPYLKTNFLLNYVSMQYESKKNTNRAFKNKTQILFTIMGN